MRGNHSSSTNKGRIKVHAMDMRAHRYPNWYWHEGKSEYFYDQFYHDPRIPRSNPDIIPTYIGSIQSVSTMKGKAKISEVESAYSNDDYDPKPLPIRILKGILYFVMIVGLLLVFICSLDLLNSAFRLIGRKATGELANSVILGNPIAGLMVGILLTVMVQSSSTSTSIIVTMVAGDLITTRQATFMLMGANIGTSITNTFVAMGNISNRQQFRQAFAGATVHDVFNWLTLVILLPLEVVSEYLNYLTSAIVGTMDNLRLNKVDILKAITGPITKLVVQLDSSILYDPERSKTEETLLKWCCKFDKNSTQAANETRSCDRKCVFLFVDTALKWSDVVIGFVLFLVSLVLLVICLGCLVKLLNHVLGGAASKSVKKFVNSNRFEPFTGYIAILLGAGITILVQSSSVFTSSITPLVGSGLISLERMYPLTLGSNIGTTITSILAALSADPDRIQLTMQTALIHLFFNITGILIWFPIPFMRAVPLSIARLLGKTTSRYRWFAVVYILWVFILFPVTVFGLSLAGWYFALVFLLLILIPLLIVSIVKIIQRRRPLWLPEKYRNWKWLPLSLRSLEPYDKVMSRCICRCCKVKEDGDEENGQLKGEDNAAMVYSTDQLASTSDHPALRQVTDHSTKSNGHAASSAETIL